MPAREVLTWWREPRWDKLRPAKIRVTGVLQ